MSAIAGKTNKSGGALPERPSMRDALKLAKEGRRGPATEADAPQRVSTLPPHRPPKIHEGQLKIA